MGKHRVHLKHGKGLGPCWDCMLGNPYTMTVSGLKAKVVDKAD